MNRLEQLSFLEPWSLWAHGITMLGHSWDFGPIASYSHTFQPFLGWCSCEMSQPTIQTVVVLAGCFHRTVLGVAEGGCFERINKGSIPGKKSDPCTPKGTQSWDDQHSGKSYQQTCWVLESHKLYQIVMLITFYRLPIVFMFVKHSHDSHGRSQQ